MSSGGERTKALNARMLGLVAAALVTIALLLAMPLSSLASARVEARAGGAVAIAGGDDCDVETNDGEQTTQDESMENTDQMQDESAENGDQSQDESTDSLDQSQDTSTDNSDQTTQDASTDSPGQTAQDESAENGDQSRDEIDSLDQAAQDTSTDDDRSQDGDDNGNRAEARAGDTVAIAGGGCDAEAENVETEDNDAEDVVTENDDEIEDLNGESDGEVIDTSDMESLLPEESSDELSAEESGDGADETQDESTAREDQLSDELETGESDKELDREETASRQGQSSFPQLSSSDFTPPRSREMDGFRDIRSFDTTPDAAMTLSIRAIKLYNVPVINSNNEKALDQGVMHVPDTANPWDREKQKNVFIAGHRLGSPKEDSRLVFYQLDELEPGDEIVLKDRRGRAYKYRVRKPFKVAPDDTWVADTLVGRDLLTLQTYTLPDFKDRLVVRADRVQPNSGQERNRR